MEIPPQAPQRPHILTAFGHERSDPWFWLREREDPEVRAYLEAENSYTEKSLSPLEGLRSTLFEEMKARILETDMSVPSRRGPWWYYGRTEEGKNYGIHCRRPARDANELPPAGEPGADEQILLDENAMAEGHEYFAVGTAVVSPDHSLLAYGTDTAGDERYELRFRSLDRRIGPSVEHPRWFPTPGTGWPGRVTPRSSSTSASTRPCAPISCGAMNSVPTRHEDVLVFEEPDRRFSLGTGRTRDGAFVLVALHSTNTAEWLAIPADDPTSDPRVVIPRREGREYAVDHLSQATEASARMVRRPDQRGRTGLPCAGRHPTRSWAAPTDGERSSLTVPACGWKTSTPSPACWC